MSNHWLSERFTCDITSHAELVKTWDELAAELSRVAWRTGALTLYRSNGSMGTGAPHMEQTARRLLRTRWHLGQVRGWVGWHHHMTLALVALWFVTLERRGLGGKNTGPDAAASAGAQNEGGVGSPRPTSRSGKNLRFDCSRRIALFAGDDRH